MQIEIPDDVAGLLTPGERLHVILKANPNSSEDEAWRTQGRRQFEGAYAPEDSVYERLADEGSLTDFDQNAVDKILSQDFKH